MQSENLILLGKHEHFELIKLFTHVLQNRCSEGARKCPRKLSV